MRGNSNWIYNGLAIFSMIIGALNVKDYFSYKPGGIATEMPMWMRPRVKMIIRKITSPWGAFIIGFLVTLFLLVGSPTKHHLIKNLFYSIFHVKHLFLIN